MAPDLIFHNAVLHTLDSRYPMATALAVSGKTILSVGGDRDILSLARGHTRIIDLSGRLVLPGFWDTHFHFYEWAMNYDNLEFSSAPAFEYIMDAVRDRAGYLGPGQWVIGQGFNESDWQDNRMPSRHDLDRAAPDNPVCIWRCDCHLAVANSMALCLAGVDKFFVPPEGAVVERDDQGVPTGVLKELAPNLIRNKIPKLPESKLLDNMEKAVSHIHGMGLTGIHDVRLMGGEDGQESMKAWQNLHRQGRLNLRCHVGLPGEMTDRAVDLGLSSGFGDDYLRIGHLKFFADGGMGARTAWMTRPYLDGGCGMPLTPMEEIETAVAKADQGGLSCMVHAIGDRANREVIQMFKRVEAPGNCRAALPHRIEHLQMIRPRDLEVLASLGHVAASCQPNNLSLDISMIDQCVGDRGKYAYSLKSILETGVPMMLSSDAPVADPNPFAGIYSAVARKRMDHTPASGWYMDQALTVEEAIRAYTLTPAQTSGRGGSLGSISPGKLADLVVTNQNIFNIPPDEIPRTRVDLTLFDGKVVHDRVGLV